MSFDHTTETLPVVPSTNGITLTGEQRKRLYICEAQIRAAQLAIGRALRIIRDERLYTESHNRFDDYLRDRVPHIAPATARQYIASAIEADRVKVETGIDLPNESVARALRRVPVTIRTAVAEAAYYHAQHEGRDMTSGDIQSRYDVIVDIVLTGGQVYIDGEPRALDAALTEAEYETMMRQRQHIRDNRKPAIVRGAKATVSTIYNKRTVSLQMDDDIDLDAGQSVRVTITEAGNDD